MTEPAKGIASRKADHIDLCATEDVGFHSKTTLLEDVELMHDALPELAFDAVDTSVLLLGKRLRAPIVIASMTGGTERAQAINRELSQIAEERGYGFGLGSQRAMLNGESVATYDVRDVAPTALILGNIGGVQARALPTEAVAEMVAQVGADALCVHLNPAMELIQSGGDRDFAGVIDAMKRLSHGLSVPVVAKETGCGIGPLTADRLVRADVRHVDVSGAGGTSWVAVEASRAASPGRALGEALREWGIPTAASVLVARATRPRFKTIIATGGVATGLDVARTIALGAHAAGIARPVLQAFIVGGRDAAIQLLDGVEAELRAVMLLVSARDVASLRKSPVLLGPRLRRWAKVAKRIREG